MSQLIVRVGDFTFDARFEDQLAPKTCAAFRSAIECGLSMGAASRAASLNPARVIGLADDVGSIEPGKRANLLVLDETLSIVAVIEDGAVVEGAL